MSSAVSPPPSLAPPAMGRGGVVLAGQSVPEPFDSFPRVLIDDGVLESPQKAVTLLHDKWLTRSPVLVELAIDPRVLREAATESREPYELSPTFDFPLERLQFLIWNNNYDCRTGSPIWWWSNKAERAFPGRAITEGEADITIDGVPTWCDGGPRQPLTSSDTVGFAILHANAIEARSLTMHRSVSPSADLAVDQLAAVEHAVGPARIIAPAGSGKTRVLTERLRHMISDRNWNGSSILALAYNKRAAEEMQQRTSELSVPIRTLNSVGLAICNGTGGFAVPLDRPRRSVIEETDVRSILESLLEVRRAANTDPYAPYIEGLRAIRLALMPPMDAEIEFDAPGLSSIFDDFCRLMDERGVIDFDGQIYEAIRILLRDGNARSTAQRISRHVLVDEFQDVTPAHLLLIRLLAAPMYDVFAVGDDDQVIYGFAGASPRFLVQYDHYFPGALHHALITNYRCPAVVVESAGKLLSYNDERVTKELRAAPSASTDSTLLSVEHLPDAELAPRALGLLQGWIADSDDPTRFAVLTRVNSTLLPVQVLLTEAGIPHRAAVGESILDRTGMRTAFAYLRIGLDPSRIHRADLREVVRRPSRRIARNVIEMMAKRTTTSIDNIRALGDYLSGSDAQRLQSFAHELDLVTKAVQGGDTASALRSIRLTVGLAEAMDTLSGSRREIDRSTHGDDLLALEQAASLHPDPATFEHWLRATLRRRPGDDGVELSTIHRVKGKEWPRIIVFGVDNGLLPHRLSTDEAEERRLLHVAITRCQDRCVVLSSAEHASPMLDELDGSREHKPITPTRPKSERLATGKRPTARPESTVAAEIGLLIRVSGGHEGEVVDVREDHALVAIGDAKMRVGFGESVSIGRQSLTLVSADQHVPLDPQTEVIADALRAWRGEAAKHGGVPAYVILSNDDVLRVAAAVPTSLKELAACKGIGPTRLERWGDEMLTVVESARSTFEPVAVETG